MWVTQSYLGNPEPNADLYVYYLFEDYVKDQTEFTKYVQHRMEDLGIMFNKKVSLIAPNERFAADIGGEIRDIDGLWRILQDKLPGIFVSTNPLSEFDISSGDYHFFTLRNLSEDEAARTIDEVRRLADEQIDYCRTNDTREVDNSLWERLYDSIQLKPGIAGFAIDLKKILRP